MTQRKGKHKKKCTTFENKTHDDGKSRNKMKQKNTKKKNRKSKVNELESIRTRTTPTALFSAMGILNADRKKCLQEMGFGSMIGMPLHEIPGMLGLYVIENLDIEKNELALTDGSIQVTPQSVHDILGAPIGGTLIESLTPRKPDDPFIKEWKSQFGEKSEVRPNDITDVIVSSNDVGSLFKMNFLMLFANTMGMCETSGACSMYILKQISNDVRVENLDWCSYIINCLKSSKDKWVNQASNYYIGPLTFMTLLYLDSTRCDSFNVVRERPAIRAWKSIQMKYREKLEIEKYGGFGMLPKHDLQSEDFVEMIQQNCNNIHQELTTISSKLNEGLSRFPECQKLNQFVIKFEEGFSKKDLAGKDDVGKEVVMDEKVEEQNKDVGKEACSMRENEDVEVVETSLPIKRCGRPMKRGRDNENNECVEMPSPIKRCGRRKKSGRDNENQDAEAVELLLSIKRCGRPKKHSYHGNVKDVNERIAEKINDEERDAEETPAFVETKDEQIVHDSCCSKNVDEKYTAEENRNVEHAEAQVEKAELIDECHNNVECSKNVKDKVENNDADENTEHSASAFDDIQEEENADDAESVETPSPIKRRGRSMKRGRDNENDEYEEFEFVDIPSPIKRRGRPKKGGRDNDNKDAEAVELSSSVKRRGGPRKQSYHGNIKVGQLAEMKTFEQGFRGAWFRCKINDIDLKKNKIKLEYYDFEEEISWTKIYALPPHIRKSSGKKKQLMLRPQYPLLYDLYYKNELPPVNSISEICVVIDDAWKVGDMVDWYKDDCYWSARVIKVLSNDKVQLELPMPPAGQGRDGDILIAFCKDLRPSLDWSQRKGWTLPTVDGQPSCGAQLIFPSKQGMTSQREEVERAAAPGGDSPLNASSTTGTGNGISVNSSAERQISEPMDTAVFENVKTDDMESTDSISRMHVEESKAAAAASEEDVD